MRPQHKTGRRTVILALMILMSILLVSQNVLSLGIAPSKKVLNYANEDVTIDATIVNDQGRDMRIVVVPQGPLAKNVLLENNIFKIASTEAEKRVSYTIKLKDSDLPPGANLFKVAFIEVPPEFKSNFIISEDQIISLDSEEKATVSATTAIIQQVAVNIPYPDSYVEGKLYIVGGDTGQPVAFSVSLFNRGNTDAKVNGYVSIKGPTNEEIARVDLGYATVAPQEESKLVGQWDDTQNAGAYVAEAYITYGEKSFPLTQQFTVGNLFVAIDNLRVGSFRLGAIAKLDVDILSTWNKAIKDIAGEMTIFDDKGGVIDSFETTRKTLPPHGMGTITGYWDTANVNVGEYDVNVQLTYEGKSTQKTFGTVVSIDSIDVKEDAAIGRVIGSKEKGNSTSLLTILVIALIVMNIGILFFFKKFKGQLKPPQNPPPARRIPPPQTRPIPSQTTQQYSPASPQPTSTAPVQSYQNSTYDQVNR